MNKKKSILCKKQDHYRGPPLRSKEILPMKSVSSSHHYTNKSNNRKLLLTVKITYSTSLKHSTKGQSKTNYEAYTHTHTHTKPIGK